MNQDQLIQSLPENIRNLIESNADHEEIRKKMAEAKIESLTIDSVIVTLTKIRLLKRRKRGFMLGIIGSVLLVAGFILTVLFYHSGASIHFAMYGLTSVGAVFLLLGMIEVLGW